MACKSSSFFDKSSSTIQIEICRRWRLREGWSSTNHAGLEKFLLRLTLNLVCSVSFFSRNRIFFSQHFSQNSISQPISVKFKQAERERWRGLDLDESCRNRISFTHFKEEQSVQKLLIASSAHSTKNQRKQYFINFNQFL